MKQTLSSSIAHQIFDFETLLKGDVTPLLQTQLKHAVVAHHKALEQSLSDSNEALEDLDKLYNKIDDHWKCIYMDMHTAVSLFQAIWLLQHFLRFKLLEDYCNEPCTVHPQIIKLAEQKWNAEECSEQALNALYQNCVILSLKELMLDHVHVENKMCAALLRDEEPGSDIQALINRHDWTSLTDTLRKNWDMMKKLFSKNDQIMQKLMHSMTCIAEDHLLKLVDSLKFRSDLAVSQRKVTFSAWQKAVRWWMNKLVEQFKNLMNRDSVKVHSFYSNCCQNDGLNLKKNE